MGDYQGIAKQFVDFYYQTFDQDRTNLLPLYRPQSMLTFESAQTQGAEQIVEKLASFPFQKVRHELATMDAQPSINNGIIVLVTGALVVDEEQRPMSYAQVFQLLPENGTYYVHHDLFKMVYPSS